MLTMSSVLTPVDDVNADHPEALALTLTKAEDAEKLLGASQPIMKNTQAFPLPLLGSILLVIFISLSAAPLIVARGDRGGGLWRGYTLLSVEAGALDAETAEEIAALPGMEAAVSEFGAEVSFTTFGGFERAAVAGVAERLESCDPRLDPYMAGVLRFFRGGKGGEARQILYLKSRRAPAVLKRQLSVLLGPRGLSWHLEGPTAAQRLFLLFCFAGAALLVLAALPGRGRIPALFGLAPWLPRVVAGGVLDLYSFLLLFPLLAGFLECATARVRDRCVLGWREGENGDLSFRALLLAGGYVLAALLFRCPGGGEQAAQGAAAWYLRRAGLLEKNSVSLAAGLLLPLLAALYFRMSRTRSFHDVFQPLPLRKVVRAKAQLHRLPAAGLLLVAAVAFPLFLRLTEKDGLEAPRPVLPAATARDGDGFSWRGIAALNQGALGTTDLSGRNPNPLPNLADYLAHRAFQEGLVFGRPYRLPTPGERLTLSYYLVHPDTREVVKTSRVVKRYQNAWLGQTLARTRASDVEGMLAAQGEPVIVLNQTEHLNLRQAFPPLKQLLVLVNLLVYLLVYLLAAAFLPDIHLTAYRLYGKRRILIRRNQHAV
jgi:hypothetical protein